MTTTEKEERKKFDFNSYFRDRVSKGLDIIFTHFSSDEPLFPRTASSLVTGGAQRDVYSKEHIMELFEESKFFDCRVSAYPKYDYFIQKGQKPWGFTPQKVLLFIDQENGDVSYTLHRLKILFNGAHPSVLWTGHGYHIYLPVLLLDPQFKNNEELTVEFLRFAEKKASNYRSDKGHYPSFRNSMLRIPFSMNSGVVKEEGEGKGKNGGTYKFQVRLLQKWDGFRVLPSEDILKEFHLMKQRIRLQESQQELILQQRIIKNGNNNTTNLPTDPFKEFLIYNSRGIADGRKNILYYVISRYLIREKCIDSITAKAICEDWLNRCSKIRKLHNTKQYLNYHIRHCIRDAKDRNRESMPVEILKHYSIEAYNQLVTEYEDFKSRTLEAPKAVGGAAKDL